MTKCSFLPNKGCQRWLCYLFKTEQSDAGCNSNTYRTKQIYFFSQQNNFMRHFRWFFLRLNNAQVELERWGWCIHILVLHNENYVLLWLQDSLNFGLTERCLLYFECFLVWDSQLDAFSCSPHLLSEHKAFISILQSNRLMFWQLFSCISWGSCCFNHKI